MDLNLILLISCILLISAAFAGISFAPWVPTWKKDLPRIFKLANIRPGETFYELGCGNGKVILYAYKNFRVKAIGLEISLPLYLICKIRQVFNYNPNLKFKFKNLFREDLRKADVIYFFGMPKPLKEKLKQKLEKELKPKTRVISYVFPIEGWQPDIVDKPKESEVPIYLYIRG